MQLKTPGTPDEVLSACEQALALAPETMMPDLPPGEFTSGAPDWYRFELDAWEIGEKIRQGFSKRPPLRKRPELLTRVADVATCKDLRRGRQSFIMALGFVAARDVAPRLVPFLTDDDVAGHVVDTLLKMKAPGYAAAVRPLLESRRAWIRRLASRYITRYPGQSTMRSLKSALIRVIRG